MDFYLVDENITWKNGRGRQRNEYVIQSPAVRILVLVIHPSDSNLLNPLTKRLVCSVQILYDNIKHKCLCLFNDFLDQYAKMCELPKRGFNLETSLQPNIKICTFTNIQWNSRNYHNCVWFILSTFRVHKRDAVLVHSRTKCPSFSSFPNEIVVFSCVLNLVHRTPSRSVRGWSNLWNAATQLIIECYLLVNLDV